MRELLDKKLNEINQKLQEMTYLVEENIEKSIEALIQQDTTLAQKIIERDLEINAYETEIEMMCVAAMATQVPVASDLRTIFSIQKIVTDLERVGDQCCNIAEVVKSLGTYDLVVSLDGLIKMGKISKEMVFDSMEAFLAGNVSLAESIAVVDDQVDEIYKEIYRDYLKFFKSDDPQGDQIIGLILVGRYFERIADHATNICERLVFLKTGKNVKY